jgi:microcystin-dependent protein
MATPFLSEIKIVSFNFAPKAWAEANGQLLPINQNQALFSLLGTTYGGNGQTNFALPNVRGRVPIHMGAGHTLGEAAGSSAVTLSVQQLPTHIHFMNARNVEADTSASALPPTNNVFAQAYAVQTGGVKQPVNRYATGNPTGTMNPAMLQGVGGSQPHTNQMPSLVLNYIIALQGIFPSQN